MEATLKLPRWVSALAGTLLVQTVCAFASISVPILGPPLMEGAGLTSESIGAVSALSAVGICWFLASGGPMLSYFGPIRTLQIGMACMMLGLLALSLPLGVIGLVGAIAIGFGNGPNTPAGSLILMRAAPPRHRTLIFSIKQAGVPLGGALAGLVSAPFAVQHGVLPTLAMLGAVLMACCLAVQPLRATLAEERQEDGRGWARAMFQPNEVMRCIAALRSHPSLPMLTAVGASYSLMQACLTAFTATFIYTRHGLSLTEAGQVVAAMLLGSMCGRVVLGWLADRVGNALRHLGGQAILSALSVVMLVEIGGNSLAVLYACASVVGFTAIGWNGIHIAELARVAPDALVSRVTSASSLFGFGASVCGPLIFMVLVAVGGYDIAFFAMSAQLACFGIICVLVRQR
jgi:MFS family permease